MLETQQTILTGATNEDAKYYFMICTTCFWCASVFELHLSKYREIFPCPVCRGSKIETIPLAANKMYNLKRSESSRLVFDCV